MPNDHNHVFRSNTRKIHTTDGSIFLFNSPYTHRWSRIGQTELILRRRVTLIAIGIWGFVPFLVRSHSSIPLSVSIFQHRLDRRNEFGYNRCPKRIITARNTIVVPLRKLHGECKCTHHDVFARSKTRMKFKMMDENARGIRWRKSKPTRCNVKIAVCTRFR